MQENQLKCSKNYWRKDSRQELQGKRTKLRKKTRPKMACTRADTSNLIRKKVRTRQLARRTYIVGVRESEGEEERRETGKKIVIKTNFIRPLDNKNNFQLVIPDLWRLYKMLHHDNRFDDRALSSGNILIKLKEKRFINIEQRFHI